ncbi:MAG: DUF58 domain-containing protein [Chloroflexi bacterium]|nr:DUF58 domain-containing protein [Chloroflexota bacterium]
MPSPAPGSITRPTAALLGTLFLALASALALGNAPLLALGVFALLVAVLGLLVKTPAGAEVQRHTGRTSVWAEEFITVEWQVKVREGIGPVFLFDRLPREMELVEGNNVRVLWKGPGEALFVNSYSLRCPKRGVYELPPTRWETRHPLEFRQPASGSSGEALHISVLPRILAVRRVRNVRGLATTPYPMMDVARLGVATTDFKEIREYVAGDPIRNINWKATARHAWENLGQPLVNQYEMEGKKALWLFVDSSRPMGVGTTLRSPLEQAVEAASALGYFYLTRGYYLGAHFSTRPNEVLYADTGRRQFQRLTEELLTLRPEYESYDLLSAIHVCQSQLLASMPRCVILTRLDGELSDHQGEVGAEDLLKGVRMLLSFSPSGRSRISVWVIGVNGYAYAPTDEVSGSVAGAIRALETRPLVRALRRSGASVLEWDPFRETFAQVLLRQLRLERGVV